MSGAYLLLADGFGGAAPPAPSAIGFILVTRPPSAYRHTARYRTDVIAALNGAERRRAVQVYPREAYQAAYHLDELEAADLRGVLYAIGSTPVLIPEEHEVLPALAEVTGYAVQVDTTRSDAFAVGVSVLIRNGADQAYGGVITAMAPGTPGANTLTLDALPTVGVTFAAGADVVPLRQIVMADGVPLARYAQGDGVLTIQGQATTLRTTIGTGASVTTFDGLPVVTAPAEREDGGPVGEQTSADLITIDYGGAFEVHTDREAPLVRRAHRWTVDGPVDRQAWKILVATLLGRQGRCLLPTWRADLALASAPGVGATTLLVTDAVDYAGVWFTAGFVWLQLAHADGSVEYAKATAAADNGNGTQSITVAAGVSGTAVTMLSLMDPVRLDTDEIAIEWEAGLVGSLGLAFATIPGG